MMMDDDGETVPRYTNEATVRIELATIPTDEFIRGNSNRLRVTRVQSYTQKGRSRKTRKRLTWDERKRISRSRSSRLTRINPGKARRLMSKQDPCDFSFISRWNIEENFTSLLEFLEPSFLFKKKENISKKLSFFWGNSFVGGKMYELPCKSYETNGFH